MQSVHFHPRFIQEAHYSQKGLERYLRIRWQPVVLMLMSVVVHLAGRGLLPVKSPLNNQQSNNGIYNHKWVTGAICLQNADSIIVVCAGYLLTFHITH